MSNVNEYISKIETGHPPVEETEDLARQQLLMETIYLGLRTYTGIDLRKFNQKFGLDFLKIYKEVIADLEYEDQIIVDESSLRLTRKGMFFLDAITSMFTSQDFELP